MPLSGMIEVTAYKKGTIAKAMPVILQLREIMLSPTEVRMAKWREEFELKKRLNRILAMGKLYAIAQKNTIMVGPSFGKDLIIQQLIGATVSPSYPLAINYIAIGTGSTTPTTSDTQLTTETNRAIVLVGQDLGYDEAVLQAFFPDSSLVNQTYYEAGGFVNGGSSANSGQIFNHALFGTPYAKVSGQDTTVQITISI